MKQFRYWGGCHRSWNRVLVKTSRCREVGFEIWLSYTTESFQIQPFCRRMPTLNCARKSIKVWWSWDFGNCERILNRAKRVYSWNTWRWVERRRGTKFSLARNHLKEHLNYCWNIFWSLTLIWKYSIMFVFSLGCCCQEEAVSDHGREENIWYIYYQPAEPDYFCNVYWRRLLVYTMIWLCWLFHQSQKFQSRFWRYW